MPFIETVADLAEALADLVGVYGGHDDGEPKPCRICWADEMANRIRAAVANERRLDQASTPVPTPPPCASCGHPRAQHVDSASLSLCEFGLEDDECRCPGYLAPAKRKAKR